MSTLVEPEPAEPGDSNAAPRTYCSWCGGARDDGAHEACDRRLALVDPPRYCASCARRMVVQVDPVGWTARCSRHGETRSAAEPDHRHRTHSQERR